MPLHAEVSIAAMIAGGRLPRPTIAGRRQTRRVVAGVILSAAVLQLLAGGATNAADPPPPGPLDRPIVDLALIDTIDDAAAPPWLLTLTTQDMPLAPWPQTIELRAVDESGNVTIGQYSLVGGIDYRALPWAAIMAFALLVGAVLSASRGAPTVREVVSLADGDPLPEIEELTPTH